MEIWEPYNLTPNDTYEAERHLYLNTSAIQHKILLTNLTHNLSILLFQSHKNLILNR